MCFEYEDGCKEEIITAGISDATAMEKKAACNFKDVGTIGSGEAWAL